MATQTLAPSSGSLFASRQSSAPAAAKPQERIRAYKDFLTPALHRRFTSAATVVLVFCWLEAVLIGSSRHVFWSWFPISIAGLRTLLLLIPCLSVFVVRVANMHVGERNANSAAEAVLASVAGPNGVWNTIYTFIWYTWSGWFFGEIYIWSSRPEDNLGWVDPGRSYERARLNENPIFLRCLFAILGLVQAARHLTADYDHIALYDLDEEQTKPGNAETEQSASPAAKLPPSLRKLVDKLGGITNRALKLTLVGFLFVSLPVYFFVVRRTVWSWTYMFGRMFFSNLPPSAPPSGLLHFGKLSWQAFTASILLAMLWEVANAAFDVYVAQAPLKKDQPLTSGGKDPNASLISGLKSKKEVPRSFAFWELAIICARFDARRQTIFAEVDRAGGSTWRQICDLALAEIAQISQRIGSVDAQGRPISPAATAPPSASTYDAAVGLPKILATQSGARDEVVTTKATPDLAHTLGNFAKSIGQSPAGHNSHPLAAVQQSAERLVPKADRQAFLDKQVSQANGYALAALQSPLGEPFRRTFAQRATTVLFGAPYSRRGTVLHAAQALPRLAVASLSEAQFGGVARDVPAIVRTFSAAVRAIERFLQTLPPDWTDVAFSSAKAGSAREVPEIREVLDVLRAGLAELVLAFGEYAGELGLTPTELREAREISSAKRPMITSGESEMHKKQQSRRLPDADRNLAASAPEMVQRRRA